MEEEYKEWIRLRKITETKEGKLCYCGHTTKCNCGDPDLCLFEESVKNKTIILGDPNNGWRKLLKKSI